MPKLRGRIDLKDHEMGKERSGSDHEAEPNDEFYLGSDEDAEGRSAEESVSGRGGSSQKKEPKPVEHGGDEANKGEEAKIEEESETADLIV